MRDRHSTRQLHVAVIGVGWIGGLRAHNLARCPSVGRLSVVDTDEDQLAAIASATGADRATPDWQAVIADPDVDAVVIATTPETLHYPMARAALEAGKHVLLEKPMSMRLEEADALVALSETRSLKLAIGFSQRFNDKQTFIWDAVQSGRLGTPTNLLISRHSSRGLANKIGNRIPASPMSICGTHDVDFALWCLQGRRPVEVYSKFAWGFRRASHGVADAQVAVVTMDDGAVVTVLTGYATPQNASNQVSAWIEVLGTEGVIFADDTRREVQISTEADGLQVPLSTMPGEQFEHVFTGPLEKETVHFVDAVVHDGPVLVDGRAGVMSLEVCTAADLSATSGMPVALPLPRGPVTPDGTAVAPTVSSEVRP